MLICSSASRRVSEAEGRGESKVIVTARAEGLGAAARAGGHD